MASMSSISASLEGDQELPVDNLGAVGAVGNSFGPPQRRVVSCLDYGYICYGGEYEDEDSEDDNDPDFPSDPEKYNALMVNLALIVDAMRRLGVFQPDDDDYYTEDTDSVVPDAKDEVDEAQASTSASVGSEVYDNMTEAGKEGTIKKKKKTVHFQDDYYEDEEDDQFVPNFKRNKDDCHRGWRKFQ